MDFDTNNHSVFMLHYHLIMCIKYRNKVINDDISNGVTADIIKQYIQTQGEKPEGK